MRIAILAAVLSVAACSKPVESAPAAPAQSEAPAAPASPIPETVGAAHDPRNFPGMVKAAQGAAATADAANAKARADAQAVGE